ncbi:MAG: thermonuclease family protein [bacterium]
MSNKINTFSCKYKIKITLISFTVIFCIFAAQFSSNKQLVNKKYYKFDTSKLYLVDKVLDGDTFEVKIEQKIMKVRMLGIDTPETIDPRKTVQCFGLEASDKTKEMLNGRYVSLKVDETQSALDKYERILAYVYRDDQLFVNEFLLKNGYAHEYTYGIPYKMRKDFKKFENDARKNKRGLWGDLCKGITI